MSSWQKNQIMLVTCIGGEKIERRWEDVPKDERQAIMRKLDNKAAEIMERYRRTDQEK